MRWNMAVLPERPWGRYLIALAAVFLAFLLREGVSFAAGSDFSQYVIFYPAVMIVALYAGLGPGIFVAVVASIFLLALGVLPWRLLPFSARTGNFVSLGFFTIVCIFLAVIADLYRRSRVKAAAYDKEQALRESQEALRQQAEMLRLSFDAIIVWTMGGGIESWNRGAEELYGYTEEEARGRDVHALLKTRHTAPWEDFERMLRAAGQWNGELAHVTRGGTEVIVSSRLHIGHGAGGELRVLQIDRDITEQKNAQRDLQRARDELEEKVQDRTADLKRANRNLLMVSACDQALVQMSDERELVAVICHIIQEEGGYPLVWVGMTGTDAQTPFRWGSGRLPGHAARQAGRRARRRPGGEGPAHRRAGGGGGPRGGGCAPLAGGSAAPGIPRRRGLPFAGDAGGSPGRSHDLLRQRAELRKGQPVAPGRAGERSRLRGTGPARARRA